MVVVVVMVMVVVFMHTLQANLKISEESISSDLRVHENPSASSLYPILQ